eukprot:6261265-Lingulodinium_polyedra.AAC.1
MHRKTAGCWAGRSTGCPPGTEEGGASQHRGCAGGSAGSGSATLHAHTSARAPCRRGEAAFSRAAASRRRHAEHSPVPG